MKIILHFCIVLLVLSSCNNNAKHNTAGNDHAFADTINRAEAYNNSIAMTNVTKEDSAQRRYVPHFTTYVFDTTQISLDSPDENQVKTISTTPKHWSQIDDFWSVYRLGNNVYCIVLQLSDGGEYVTDSLFKACHVYANTIDTGNHDPVLDTSTYYLLRENTKFSRAMLSNDTTRWFYVYCTKGLAHVKMGKVLYFSNGCVYFIALQLPGIDTVKFGMPVIASQSKINLTYSSIPAFQQNLNEYSQYKYSLHTTDWDWPNSIPPSLFAYNDSLYFTYTDNFKGYRKNDTIGLFPERRIFISHGNKVTEYYQSNVDFFGIGFD